MEINHQYYQYNISEPPFNDNFFLTEKLIPYWSNFWKKLLKELKSSEGLRQDELYWQDRIVCITNNSNIVAIHFIARYPMSEFANSEYAKRYLPKNMADTYQNKRGFINTIQYLSVDPAYSYRRTGINFASVLIDSYGYHQAELQAAKTVCVARKSVGVHNLGRKFGFRECCTATKHNVDVSIVQTEKPLRHPRKSVREISDYLWRNRKFIDSRKLAA